MTQREALLAAIDANTHRDSCEFMPVVVYADYIDDETDEGFGPGLRELARLRRKPWYWQGSKDWGWWVEGWAKCYPVDTETAWSCLPRGWLETLNDIVESAEIKDMSITEKLCTTTKGTESRGAGIAFEWAAKAWMIWQKKLAKERKKLAKRLRRELKLGGPGLDGYVYNADVYCEYCGQDIIDQMTDEQLVGIPEYLRVDTDHLPQPIFSGESDCAQHCGHCGEYLYGPQEDDDGEADD